MEGIELNTQHEGGRNDEEAEDCITRERMMIAGSRAQKLKRMIINFLREFECGWGGKLM